MLINFVNSTFPGLMIPFLGTALGSACVFFMRGELNPKVQKSLQGFASGVMVAASIWSLILPAFNLSSHLGKLSFLPPVIGFWIGIVFLLAVDHLVPHLHLGSTHPEGHKSHLKKTTMMVLAVTIHNLPEGMAVGIVYAGFLSGSDGISALGALILALGIAIQNFPEGAIISMPLRSEGASRKKSFVLGVLSGAVEPVGAFFTIIAAALVLKALPYLLTFAAGAMMYVVVEELIPEMSEGEHSDVGVFFFAFGFTLMMALDVALG